MNYQKLMIGFALGFGIKFIEDATPSLVRGRWNTALYQSNKFTVGVNDAAQAGGWLGVALLLDQDIGLGGLFGLAAHQVAFYVFGVTKI